LFIDTCIRDKSVRFLIGHYLSHAVSLARRTFDIPRLVIYSDFDNAGVVLHIGRLSGTADFVCCTVLGEGGLGISFKRLKLMKGNGMAGAEGGVYFIVDTPSLVVLEEKKSNTGEYSAEAELLAHLRVLIQKSLTLFYVLTVSDGKARTGILTDGFKWRITHLDEQFRMFSTVLRTDTWEQRMNMLG
jgi:hypothetical protein